MLGSNDYGWTPSKAKREATFAEPPGSTAEHFQPDGVKWRDAETGRMVTLVHGGEWDGWLCYQHPDGQQWVTLRKLTQQESDAIRKTILATVEQSNGRSEP